MIFPNLAEEQQELIAKQVAELIDAFTSSGKLGSAYIPVGLSIFESCPEEIIDLPRQWTDSQEWNNIEQWRRRQATWYHQLRTATQRFGFARSIELHDGSHRVIEVVPSTVAEEFQKAIRLIDDEEQKEDIQGCEPTGFLLHVPRYAFYGLATAGAVTSPSKMVRAISRVYPFFRERLGLQKHRLDRESLLSLISRLPDALGALSTVNSLKTEITPPNRS